ncbi:MAG TPA: hypothetical protein VL490_10465 [Mucilaginibacter sp.]|jgi:hypothetical protein|nr:hypothetical protein [Mucilaginibacter sp.]
MFDPDLSYQYHRVGDHSGLTTNRKYVEHLTIYQFRTDLYPYLIEVERYPYNIYVFKFYRRFHKKNKQKFNLLTNEGRCSRIVGTCFSIFLTIFSKNPLASFGFLGANTIDESKGIVEQKRETRRFVVYRQAVQNYFGMETFTHFEDTDTSIYLSISNQNKDIQYIADKAADMITHLLDQE